MNLKPESLRYILGLKLRRHRQVRGLGLKEVARQTGLSVSYLSEIEKGRKYPKPEKIVALAQVLGVSYDELVSLKLDEELMPVGDILTSSFMQEFPFHLYGIDVQGLLGLLIEAPPKAGALVRTMLEIGQTYDMQVEHFLFAALRSYQHLHQNYFEDIERAAEALREECGWSDEFVGLSELERVLTEQHGYQVRFERFGEEVGFQGLQSVFIDRQNPRLLINERLLPAQKVFQLARELGYVRLGLKERSMTSSPLRVDSFDQVIHDFQAAYFAGAVLIQRQRLVDDIAALFENRQWSAQSFLDIQQRFPSTPETFFYRLSQLVPKHFGLRELYFLRFSHEPDKERFELSKIFNMSQLPIVHGLEPGEHYCRRWAGLRLLRSLADREHAGSTPDAEAVTQNGWMVTAQRANFVAEDKEFFVMTMGRPLALDLHRSASVSLGLLVDRAFKRRVRFWNDPKIPQVEVNLTCERCGLTPEECEDRAAPARLFDQAERRRKHREHVARLIDQLDDD